MKTDTQIMNELAVATGWLKPISPEDARALKTLLLEMLQDITALCEKHNLIYMLGGGSCLGAVRHQGYIPWDDDLDIMMPRLSYEKLIHLLSMNALGSNYEYDAPNPKFDCKNPFLKIYRKGTLNVEIMGESAPGPKGIYIDVFPMDYAPKNLLYRSLKGFLSDLLQAVCSSVLYTEYPSLLYKEFMRQSAEGSKRYQQRMLLGKLLGIIPHRKWVWWFDRLNCSKRNTGFITIPTGRKHYMGEVHAITVFLPTKKGIFEGMKVNLPADTDTYLNGLYGDYMCIPPEEKRERHFVYRFSLNQCK